MTRLAALAAKLRRRPVDALTMDDLYPARPGWYVPKHRGPGQAMWKPAHTGRHRAQHSRPEGQRPDLRIEQTQALDLSRLNQMLDLGDILRMGKGGAR